MHPLRVAFLVDPLTVRTPGGRHAARLARELLARGHLVTTSGAPLGIEDHGVLAVQKRLAPVEVVQRFQPDAIVAYDGLSPAAWLGARSARRLGVPLVLVEPGSAHEDARSWRLLHRLGGRLWGAYVRQSTSALVALDPLARDLALAEGFPERRISILPEGLDLEAFRPGRSTTWIARHRIGGRLLFYTGPLDATRGLEVLLRAFWRTVGQREDWKLVLAGDGAGKRRLRVEVERLGISARVLFLPRPDLEELPGLLGASTLFAAPALDDVPRGRQVARAMACGLPVIAADRPRLRFLVEHEGTGLLVPPGDEEAWTRALGRAAISPGARERWGRRARELAEERLDWSRVAAAFEEVLREARERRAA